MLATQEPTRKATQRKHNMPNPFVLATPVQKKLKILLYGAPGTGKTLASLSFPKCAYIDSEGGADLYAGRPGIQPFHIFRTKGLSDLERAIQFIEIDNGATFETLIVDPITVFYDVEKQALTKSSKNQRMDMQGWTKLNNRMKSVYNRLTNLPVHVIIIAREAIEYEGEGLNLKKVGFKPDSDKSLPYLVDFSIRVLPNHSGVIDKSRGYEFGKNGKINKVQWEAFEPVANQFLDGDVIQHQSEDQASETEANQLSTLNNARAFMKRWREETDPVLGTKFIDSQILILLGVSKLSLFTGTVDEANKRMQSAIDSVKSMKSSAEQTTEQGSPPPQTTSPQDEQPDNVTQLDQPPPQEEQPDDDQKEEDPATTWVQIPDNKQWVINTLNNNGLDSDFFKKIDSKATGWNDIAKQYKNRTELAKAVFDAMGEDTPEEPTTPQDTITDVEREPAYINDFDITELLPDKWEDNGGAYPILCDFIEQYFDDTANNIIAGGLGITEPTREYSDPLDLWNDAVKFCVETDVNLLCSIFDYTGKGRAGRINTYHPVVAVHFSRSKFIALIDDKTFTDHFKIAEWKDGEPGGYNIGNYKLVLGIEQKVNKADKSYNVITSASVKPLDVTDNLDDLFD